MTHEFKNPFIESVSVSRPDELLVTFSNQEKKLFNIEPYLKGAAFASLRDIAQFEKVKILNGWGLSWPGEIDLSHDTIYLDAISFDGESNVSG
jgi:hypothetical protein